MAKLIFFSPYPNETNMQDGFFVRVKNIDNVFLQEQRIYLYVSLRRNLRFKKTEENNKLTIVEANAFFHYFKILSILNCANIYYVQSLYNYFWTFLFPMKKNKKIVWDVHGAVSEELAFDGRKTFACWADKIESSLANRATVIVSVTNAIYNHLSKKYPKLSKNNIIYPIINNSFFIAVPKARINALRTELGIMPDNVVFIYSGSLIKWQRFDDILNIIKYLNNPVYRFIILTGQVEDALQKIKDNHLENKNIVVKTVKPDELAVYYSLAHYGFILRDNHILNQVAAPTKLLEYLYYGIIPIVDYEKIGDFYDLGYQYIDSDAISDNIPICRSEKNANIIKSFFLISREEDFRKMVLNEIKI